MILMVEKEMDFIEFGIGIFPGRYLYNFYTIVTIIVNLLRFMKTVIKYV